MPWVIPAWHLPTAQPWIMCSTTLPANAQFLQARHGQRTASTSQTGLLISCYSTFRDCTGPVPPNSTSCGLRRDRHRHRRASHSVVTTCLPFYAQQLRCPSPWLKTFSHFNTYIYERVCRSSYCTASPLRAGAAHISALWTWRTLPLTAFRFT